jgi:NADPH:quinone reductase-like Zn-dependent oxidoreductase
VEKSKESHCEGLAATWFWQGESNLRRRARSKTRTISNLDPCRRGLTELPGQAVGGRTLHTTWVDGDPKGDETVHTLGNTIPGGLAEYLSIHERAVVKAPTYLTDEEASTLPVAALTAWFSLIETGKLSSDQTVVLQGTGGVSLFGLQIASAFGARSLINSSSDEKLERAKAFGAYAGINYARTPEWEKEVLKLTDMQGADHVLEVVGGKSLAQSLASLKAGGRMSVIGVQDGFVSEVPSSRY